MLLYINCNGLAVVASEVPSRSVPFAMNTAAVNDAITAASAGGAPVMAPPQPPAMNGNSEGGKPQSRNAARVSWAKAVAAAVAVSSSASWAPLPCPSAATLHLQARWMKVKQAVMLALPAIRRMRQFVEVMLPLVLLPLL